MGGTLPKAFVILLLLRPAGRPAWGFAKAARHRSPFVAAQSEGCFFFSYCCSHGTLFLSFFYSSFGW